MPSRHFNSGLPTTQTHMHTPAPPAFISAAMGLGPALETGCGTSCRNGEWWLSVRPFFSLMTL